MLGAFSVVNGSFGTVGAHFSAALAECLAAKGKRVLLFELSPSCPTLDLLLGVSERVVYTLTDTERLSPENVALTVRENLSFIPLGVGEVISDTSFLEACVKALSPDVVLLSTERSQLPLARRISDGVLLVTDASQASLRANAFLSSKESFDGFVLSDFVPTKEYAFKMLSLAEISDTLGLPLFGILPRIDRADTPAAWGKDFLFAVRNMAGRLLGETVPLLCGIPIEGMRRRDFFARTSE